MAEPVLSTRALNRALLDEAHQMAPSTREASAYDAPMTHAEVQRWLGQYIAAWRANEVGPIEALFTDDAVYGYRPWDSDDHTMHGRDAIVSSWLEEPDAPGSWEAHYEPYAVEGDRAVATGWSRYAPDGEEPERTYHNAYLMRFASDGRCAEFHELYMLEGK